MTERPVQVTGGSPNNIGWQIPNSHPQQAKPVQPPVVAPPQTTNNVIVNQAPPAHPSNHVIVNQAPVQPHHTVIVNQPPVQPHHTVIVQQAPIQPQHTVIVQQAPVQPVFSVPLIIPSINLNSGHTHDKKETHSTSVNSTIIYNNYYNGTAPDNNSSIVNITTPANSLPASNNNSTNTTSTHIVTQTIITKTHTIQTTTKSSSFKIQSTIFYPILSLIFVLNY